MAGVHDDARGSIRPDLKGNGYAAWQECLKTYVVDWQLVCLTMGANVRIGGGAAVVQPRLGRGVVVCSHGIQMLGMESCACLADGTWCRQTVGPTESGEQELMLGSGHVDNMRELVVSHTSLPAHARACSAMSM